MRPTHDPAAPDLGQDVAAVLGGAAYLTDIERRLAASCEQAEPRPQARASRRGRRRPAERQNRWPWAEGSGAATP